MNIPNHCCLMVADDSWMTTSKWEVIELQSKSCGKDLHTTLLLLKGLETSGDRLFYGLKTTNPGIHITRKAELVSIRVNVTLD